MFARNPEYVPWGLNREKRSSRVCLLHNHQTTNFVKVKEAKIKPQFNTVKSKTIAAGIMVVQLFEEKTGGQSFSTAAFVCCLTSSVNDRFSRGTLAISHAEGDPPWYCKLLLLRREYRRNPTEMLHHRIPDMRYKSIKIARNFCHCGWKDVKLWLCSSKVDLESFRSTSLNNMRTSFFLQTVSVSGNETIQSVWKSSTAAHLIAFIWITSVKTDASFFFIVHVKYFLKHIKIRDASNEYSIQISVHTSCNMQIVICKERTHPI